ncbi:single-stranded DNA-binding protein [Fervidicoccus fontis]|nr:single-stranded DNA-binding protein [Fervidicoccus fontis]PMB76231.1 MAG: single-stranded DNA-binding protein [Fervidicoccus fontis]HEW63802.1 single-stranded DNA-binding protein [Fervidicoccus fontis]
MGEEPQNKKIMDLKQGESSVSIKARVLETGDTKTIETKKGTRTISEAILGDDTGRIKATFWGDKAGSVQEGQAVEVKGAWTTSFRGKVQLNVGSSSEVSQIDDSEVPQKDEVPESEPTAPMEDRGYGSRRQGGGRRDYRQGRNYPRKREW